jgi:hypothetical protein
MEETLRDRDLLSPALSSIRNGGEGEDLVVARFYQNSKSHVINGLRKEFLESRHPPWRVVLREETLRDQRLLSPALSSIRNGGEGEDPASARFLQNLHGMFPPGGTAAARRQPALSGGRR